MTDRLWLGRRGESVAHRYLRRRGLRIIERRWRCPIGELDLVAQDGNQLVIIEVRTAKTAFAGNPVATIGPRKRQKLRTLARRYLQTLQWRVEGVRFDVIGVVYRGLWRWDVTWIPDAFESDDA
jgi:putative endonuclease